MLFVHIIQILIGSDRQGVRRGPWLDYGVLDQDLAHPGDRVCDFTGLESLSVGNPLTGGDCLRNRIRHGQHNAEQRHEDQKLRQRKAGFPALKPGAISHSPHIPQSMAGVTAGGVSQRPHASAG